MSGTLLLPRVRVTWGKINLSSYNGSESFPQGSPLVYDVEVEMQAQNTGPTARMKWDPTGPGYAVYEKFISSEELLKTRIFIEFFYTRGKRIRMAFVWSGQSINYGNDMSVTVMMVSELAGLVNSEIRNSNQAFDEKKGGTFIDSIDKGAKQFSVDSNLIRYSATAKKDMQKAKLITNYTGATDQTFGAFVAKTVEQNGNKAFPNCIEEPNIVIFPPFSWDKDGTVLNGATEIPFDASPKPEERYGYLIGPSIINSLTRESQWIPPQQSTQNSPGSQIRARDPRTGRFVQQTPATAQQVNSTAASGRTSAPLGTALSRANPGIQNKDNPDGPTKQIALNAEGTASLSFHTLLVPVLVGIKPNDILYIPSLKGDYIEDWIIDTVSYDQNDGNVSVSVTAKRVQGLGTPMVPKQAEKFLKYAKEKNLVGPTSSLKAWEGYSWGLIA
jgi:hypothetical protein